VRTSSSTSSKDTVKVSEKNRNNSSNMPNQYGRVKNTVKGEGEVHNNIDQDYGLIDEFLEAAVNT
jgi:hypothetical protein